MLPACAALPEHEPSLMSGRAQVGQQVNGFRPARQRRGSRGFLLPDLRRGSPVDSVIPRSGSSMCRGGRWNASGACRSAPSLPNTFVPSARTTAARCAPNTAQATTRLAAAAPERSTAYHLPRTSLQTPSSMPKALHPSTPELGATDGEHDRGRGLRSVFSAFRLRVGPDHGSRATRIPTSSYPSAAPKRKRLVVRRERVGVPKPPPRATRSSQRSASRGAPSALAPS